VRPVKDRIEGATWLTAQIGSRMTETHRPARQLLVEVVARPVGRGDRRRVRSPPPPRASSAGGATGATAQVHGRPAASSSETIVGASQVGTRPRRGSRDFSTSTATSSIPPCGSSGKPPRSGATRHARAAHPTRAAALHAPSLRPAERGVGAASHRP
jgi:hypothetical protein